MNDSDEIASLYRQIADLTAQLSRWEDGTISISNTLIWGEWFHASVPDPPFTYVGVDTYLGDTVWIWHLDRNDSQCVITISKGTTVPAISFYNYSLAPAIVVNTEASLLSNVAEKAVIRSEFPPRADDWTISQYVLTVPANDSVSYNVDVLNGSPRVLTINYSTVGGYYVTFDYTDPM